MLVLDNMCSQSNNVGTVCVTKVGEKALECVKVHRGVPKPQKRKIKVVDEDRYIKGVEKIIVRDFYPDLPKMKVQCDYLDAEKNNDVQKLREISAKYTPKRSASSDTPEIYSTPTTFETPNVSETPEMFSKDRNQDEMTEDNTESNKLHSDSNHRLKEESFGLDAYLSKVTSEDNASFKEMLHENELKHEQKHAWLYEKEVEASKDVKDTLCLPTIEQQAIESGPRTHELKTWEYKAKNALMYVPDGVEFSDKEIIERKKNYREIIYNNTRYKELPFDYSKNKESIAAAAQAQVQIKHGKIGVDGKEVQPQQSPQIGGFSFVSTPSPVPGGDESPFMTWGEIEGTPFRLDGSDTPTHKIQGPKFRIPDVPRRDELLLELTENAGKAHRAKKKDALKRVSALKSPSPSPVFGSSRSERLNSMSPAAQRLVSSKLGVRIHSDKALRASYTPSPKTPVQLCKTPSPKIGHKTPMKNKTPKSEIETLTDNLLQIPRRSRVQASDFF